MAGDSAGFAARIGGIGALVNDRVTKLGGTISAEHGIGSVKRDELARYGSPIGLDVMRRLKSAFDPHDILNPGKVVRV